MKTSAKNPVVDLLLREERGLLPSLFLLPFKNALMKGATMDEESVSYFRKLRWGAVLMSLIFLIIAIEPFVNEAMNASDALLGFILAFLAIFGIFLFSVALIGYQWRETVQTDEVAKFDLNVAKSGGLWGVLGLSLWSLFRFFFAS